MGQLHSVANRLFPVMSLQIASAQPIDIGLLAPELGSPVWLLFLFSELGESVEARHRGWIGRGQKFQLAVALW